MIFANYIDGGIKVLPNMYIEKAVREGDDRVNGWVGAYVPLCMSHRGCSRHLALLDHRDPQYDRIDSLDHTLLSCQCAPAWKG